VYAQGEMTDEPMNDFEADVFDSLTSKGMKLVPQVGCSKYRIDLAAAHPENPGQFVLAIECDGATYHSSYTARDRDRLRQAQLENLGWTFHRIWSTDWFMRKDEEVLRAVKAFDRAVANAACRNGISKAPPGEKLADPPHPRRPPLPIPARASISDYTSSELEMLLAWVKSDGKLRTNDELADEMFAALPFNRRGTRIEAALRRAISRAPR
jgi:very-short-patch-repair endonuclease